MSTTYLIAEDEALLAAELAEELARLWPQARCLGCVADGHAALQAFEAQQPQVLFLDVQMPGLSGLEVARLVGQRAHIVFITAYDQYAVRAFDEGAADYVLKPLEPARLARAVQRLKSRLQASAQGTGRMDPAGEGADSRHDATLVHSAAATGTVAAGAVPAAVEPLRWITVLRGRELQLITVEDVCYFQADNKYVEVVTASGSALISTPLKELVQRLPAETFWQVHRSTIVNLAAIRGVTRELGGRMSITLKQRPEVLQVGAAYAHRFRQL
jgi:DNA-binding LytR/AlgR family response regulator